MLVADPIAEVISSSRYLHSGTRSLELLTQTFVWWVTCNSPLGFDICTKTMSHTIVFRSAPTRPLPLCQPDEQLCISAEHVD